MPDDPDRGATTGRDEAKARIAAVRAELFERDRVGRSWRFTQDGPILPDVWLAYAADPHGQHDLLVNPRHGERAGRVAREMRTLIDNLRGFRSSADGTGPKAWGGEPPRIAHVPGLIAARLYFNELLRIVLPSTHWWSVQMAELSRAFETRGVTFSPLPSAERHRLFDTEQKQVVRDWLAEIWPDGTGDEGERPVRPDELGREPPYAFLKLIRLATMVVEAQATGRISGEIGAEGAVDTFAGLYENWPADPAAPPTGRAVWSVTLNRDAEPVVNDSTRAMKADAGRRLFEIRCDRLRWAIIDGGIDASHPAFLLPDEGPERDDAGGRLVPAEGRASRVIQCFDFGELRLLLDPVFLAHLARRFGAEGADPYLYRRELDDWEAAALAKVSKRLHETVARRMPTVAGDDDRDLSDTERHERTIRRQIRLVIDRIDEGLEIDWGTIEPLIEDVTPDRPTHAHGTNVAGVLAADWRQDYAGEEETLAVGVCPDLRLIDLRVLARSHDGRTLRAHDFEVISALKFIGYLNSRADEPMIHGANVSIAIPHDVSRFACGRTPVCEECERLVSSGVVVVAAAGNGGYADGGDAEDRFYRHGTITDPGNAEGVITVGATHRSRPHQYGVSYFSSRGPTGDGRRKPDLVAPGEKIATPSPGNRIDVVDGTSFAAPHVSGAAAMLMARHSELIGQPARIKTILCTTATDLRRDHYFQGAGMLDILRALQSV